MKQCEHRVRGLKVQELQAGEIRVLCIPDPAPMAWSCEALLVGMNSERLREAERLLPLGLVDADRGMITISFNTYLVQTPRHTVMIDAGIGNDKERLERPVWHHRAGQYLDVLGHFGVAPGDVDAVINTHLHADHTGWNTRLDGGRWVPTFPRARYLCSRADLEYWLERYKQDRKSGVKTLFGSFADSVMPLIDARVMEGLPCDAEPLPGIRFRPAPGHSPGMVAVHVETGRAPLHLWSDIAHHPVQFLWNDVVSIACTEPEQARQTRRDAIRLAIEKDAIVSATHFAAPFFGRPQVSDTQTSFKGL